MVKIKGIVLLILFFPQYALARVISNSCYDECGKLFNEISFGNPIIGFLYLVVPIGVGTWAIGQKAPKRKRIKESEDAQKIGRTFTYLAIFCVGFFLYFTL
ncbi:hypothetical protein RI844_13600 [Thalassotalea fonticola]|uniref:Uncharacterized protein n=1 Tax=Thalassotalea fonticola TaxID=3065649 RepID=A0ABZ0GM15_9GAMM|nr:hypothetical protein RI844_13600 [Colwelliaceae bacterium S1-1]